MSDRRLYRCQYCNTKRKFKTLVYLEQHQANSTTCCFLQKQQRQNCNNNNNGDDADSFADPHSLDDSSAGSDYPHAEANLPPNDCLPDGVTEFVDDQCAGDNDVTFYSSDSSFDSWGAGTSDDDEDLPEDPSQKSLLDFKKCCRYARDHAQPFSQDDIASIELLALLKKKKAPLDTYDAVQQWHERHSPPCNRLEKPKSRPQIIKMLQERYNFPQKLAEVQSVLLPHSQARVNVICHDAEAAVVSLLTDPRFSDDDFLHFNDDPLAPPPSDLDYIDDINTGMCYTTTYHDLITDPKKEMLVPIIFYIDGAVAGQFEKLQVKPLKITLGILNRKARDKEYAWRTIGYVPNYTPADSRAIDIIHESGHFSSDLFHVPSDAAAAAPKHRPLFREDDDDDKEDEYDLELDYEIDHDKAQDFHTILATILTSFRKKLQDRGMTWDYRYRGRVYKGIQLKFFTAFFKCDTDEADELCAKFKVRNKNVAHLCRYCDCPTDKTDDVSSPQAVSFIPWTTPISHLLSPFFSRSLSLTQPKLWRLFATWLNRLSKEKRLL